MQTPCVTTVQTQSNAEIFAEGFRRLGLGPVVGRRAEEEGEEACEGCMRLAREAEAQAAAAEQQLDDWQEEEVGQA